MANFVTSTATAKFVAGDDNVLSLQIDGEDIDFEAEYSFSSETVNTITVNCVNGYVISEVTVDVTNVLITNITENSFEICANSELQTGDTTITITTKAIDGGTEVATVYYAINFDYDDTVTAVTIGSTALENWKYGTNNITASGVDGYLFEEYESYNFTLTLKDGYVIDTVTYSGSGTTSISNITETGFMLYVNGNGTITITTKSTDTSSGGVGYGNSY